MKMTYLKVFSLCLLLFVFTTQIFGEEKAQSTETEQEMAINFAKAEKAKPTGLPRMYRALGLGMHIEAIKEELKKDVAFDYRGERDVSLLPTQNRSLIETAGNYFIRRAWFQFYNENLYTMIFKLNTDRVDYYSIYTNLCDKYGEPQSLNPQQAVWQSKSERLVLERPLSIKYIDLETFNVLLDQSTVEQATSERNLENFINSF